MRMRFVSGAGTFDIYWTENFALVILSLHNDVIMIEATQDSDKN